MASRSCCSSWPSPATEAAADSPRDPNPDEGWDDDGEVIRHIIDFVRLPVKLAAAGDAAHAEPEAARVVG